MSTIDTPRSTVIIPLFLVILAGGGLLTAAATIYLYFGWEKHFPPMADLKAQVIMARNLGQEDVEAEEEFDRTGVGEWMDDLNERWDAQGEAAVEDPAAEDLAEAYPGLTSLRSPTTPLIPQTEGEQTMVAINRQLDTLRSQAALARGQAPEAPEQVRPTAPPASNSPLKQGGTIEKMEEDWLPPGVTRSD